MATRYSIEMATTGSLTLFTLLFTFGNAVNVPLVAFHYGNSPLHAPSNILSGHTLEAKDVFTKQIKPYMDKNPLVIFLQDQLSIDDFTKYSQSFSNLKNILKSQESFILPSVSQSKENIYSIVKSLENVKEIYSSDPFTWSFENLLQDNKIVLFHLEPVAATSNEGRGETMKRNVELIKRFLKNIESFHSNFAVILTANEPSQDISLLLEAEQQNNVNQARRHLLATEDGDSTQKFFNNSGLVYLYLRHLRFGKIGEQVDLITNKTKWEKKTGAGCSSIKSCINLVTNTEVGGITKFDMLIDINTADFNTTGEWHCSQITVKVTINGTTEDLSYNCDATNTSVFVHNVYATIRAPMGMSYGCNNMTFLPNNKGNRSIAKNFVLSLGGMQIQPDVKGYKFGHSYNCVGFFSLEILTGIFVTIVLAFGLFVGISMMMAIQTQDRFDDPKGPMISVPTQE